MAGFPELPGEDPLALLAPSMLLSCFFEKEILSENATV